jgi:hypothetical protein
MRQVRIPQTDIKTQYVKFYGGLDLASPVLSLKPGNALEAVNYEPGLMGGYQRIDGFERFDGRPKPSAATYTYLEGTITGAIAVGATLTGATSGATGRVVVVDLALGAVCVTKVTGTFVRNENIKVGATVVGQIKVDPTPRGYRDVKNDAIALAAAADNYRADIGAVPGQGPIRGAWMYKGTVYAFRDAVGGATCGMYKSSAAGWTAVPLGRVLQLQQPSKAATTSGGAVQWTAHGLAAGALVRLSGTIPANAQANTNYFLVNVTANSFQLSLSAGGTALALGDVAAGLTVLPQVRRINEGDTITGVTSGATAVVTRAVVNVGAWDSFAATVTATAAGVTGSVFQVGELVKVNGNLVASVLTADKANVLQPGGRFEFVTYNFTGATDTRRMYACDGVNPAFEFDGTVFLPIYTGMNPDNPKFIKAHKQKLWLAYKGSVQHSGDGSPYAWTILAGADELGMGDDVTGMEVQPGDTLAIFTRGASSQLNGATNDTFQLLPISNEVGAIAYTVQTVGKTMGLDDRGLVATDRTQAYGNFVQGTISLAIQPLIAKLRATAIGSVVYRNRNQYRLYSSDGTGIIATFGDQGLIGMTKLAYPVKPVCFASCEDASGNDVVLFGSDTGYVYQADVGSSFDGAPIEAYLRMPFNNISSPRLRKRFRKAIMEMSASAYASIRFQPEFSYGDPDVGTHRLQTGETTGSGGYWDVDNWDGFFYDARLVTTPEFSIEGTGLNMALIFYSSSAIDLGHTLQGMLIHFSNRRLSR